MDNSGFLGKVDVKYQPNVCVKNLEALINEATSKKQDDILLCSIKKVDLLVESYNAITFDGRTIPKRMPRTRKPKKSITVLHRP